MRGSTRPGSRATQAIGRTGARAGSADALAAGDHVGAGSGVAASRVQCRTQHRSGVECSQTSGLSFSDNLRAAEQDRPDVAWRRKLWRATKPVLDPESKVFLDKTGVNTKMARLYG